MTKIRIASWNCGGGFKTSKKLDFIKSFDADILICQEPRDNELENFKKIFWVTNQPEKSKPKGLGVYTSNEAIKIKPLPFSKDFELIQPLEVNLNNRSFNLMAVWSYNRRSQGIFKGKRGMMIEALKHYAKDYSKNTIWIGDFNNGPTIKNAKFWNPLVDQFKSNRVDQLEFQGSPYTHYNNKGTLHKVDHCFVSVNRDFNVVDQSLIPLETSPSDHAPLLVDIRLTI
jgi:exonuclease III